VSKALRQAGEALGKALGSVDRMFEEGALTNGLSSRFGSTFYKVLPLHPDIKNLSAEVMEVLLGSDTLQLRSENDAHYLLCAWLSQSPQLKKSERQARFQQLLPQLRFPRMSQDFHSTVISTYPYANTPHLLRRIMRLSHAPCTAPWSQAEIERHGVKLGQHDRDLDDLSCHLYCKLELTDILPLSKRPSKPNSVYKFVGLAVGFPVVLSVVHEAEGTMGLYVDAGVPVGKEVDASDESYACFNFSVKAGGETYFCKHFFNGEFSWGWPDFFGRRSWEEVVCPESPYFPNGVLEVELTMAPIQRENEKKEEEEEDEEEEEEEE